MSEAGIGDSASGAEEGAAPARRRWLRRCVLALIGLLYVISVPWYRAAGSHVKIVAGLPDWVAVALACYVAVAILNGVAWLLTEVGDPREPGDASPHPGPGQT